MTGKKVFVSYCWKQGEWVWDRLVPCLKAGGADPLIDRERLKAGTSLVGQMDAWQDQADCHVLALSPDYLASAPCQHEMHRAVELDPDFKKVPGVVIPVLRVSCTLPDKIAKPNPLYVDLRDDTSAMQWDKLMDACGADLGTDAAAWLKARDDVRRFVRDGVSVNSVVTGKPKCKELIERLSSDDDPRGRIPDFAIVDLESGATTSRRGLVTSIIRGLGGTNAVPEEPEDLVELDRFFKNKPGKSYLAFRHFDYAAHRPQYGVDLFGALRYLASDQRKLVLLIQSRAPLQTLLPKDHPLSSAFTSVQTVELRGRP